jgi:recombinational DNA repair ATPase RecF
MQLQKLILSNFQGLKSFTFEPDGMDTTVFGTNASGKTTLYNAYTWLLFDKASTGENRFL